MFNGLRKRPTYEDISQEINPDKTKVIYPNGDAKFLREDPRMTQLDGIGFFESMKDQEEATIKEQRKETIIRQMSAEAKIKHGTRKTPTFDMTDDDGVPTDTYEEELAEKEKYQKERTEAKKEKMKTGRKDARELTTEDKEKKKLAKKKLQDEKKKLNKLKQKEKHK